MLINSVRFYERVLEGLHSPEAEVRENAKMCESFLVFHMANRQLSLPPPVVDALDQLPEVAT